jgi:hypothetical protein
MQPSWDCPICGTNEAMREEPRLHGNHDWACYVCGAKGWGEPMDWDYLSEPTSEQFIHGHRDPDGPAWRAHAHLDGGETDA